MDIMDQYEKIRIVGKGAFGVAVLYRKLKTNQLVVLKEINTNDLSPTERQLAQNEVEVLSVLNHPNIISYGGSFEFQGNLMIEMEYADGGTLAQLLSKSDLHFSERQILNLVQQICSALRHMHSHKILHRDLKTANVFMTAKGDVKIGDFGISKVLTTNAQAQTVLGTPYYLSPEMCEGKDYNEKSDIWALGCILYEMCCLHKTFQASTLPALVNKIMKAEYKPIPGGYSDKLKKLLKELLDKDPKKRPSANEIIDQKIPDIIESLGDKGNKYEEPQMLSFPTLQLGKSKSSMKSGLCERSVVYQVKSFESDINIQPIQLPPKLKIKHMTVSDKHFVVVSTEGIVFTWGIGTKGQLGCGTDETWRQYPAIVSDLLGKEIVMCSAGDDFSIFLSEGGELYSCGDGSQGALGHGSWDDLYSPKLIEFMLGVKVSSISSGSTHAVALTISGEIYSWGGGTKGQTGHNKAQNLNIPRVIVLPIGLSVVSVRCGGDSTMVLSSQGSLLACGCNQYNKLGLNGVTTFYNSTSYSHVTSLKEIKMSVIPGKVIDCSVGVKHSVILVKLGYNKTAVYTLGYPFHKKISLEEFQNHIPERIYDLDDIAINMLSCGPTYTVVGTNDNCILLWGTRYGIRGTDIFKANSQESSGVWSQQSFQKRESSEHTSDDSARTIPDMLTATYMPEIISKPISLLALYSSPSQVSSGHVLTVEGQHPLAHSTLIVVNTTTVLIKDRQDNINDVQLQDCDSIGPIPNWMKAEVEQAQYPWYEK